MTRQGDVLFLSRGHRLYSVVVPEIDPNTIATGYFFILRPKQQVVLPEFLAWSMNQPDFHERLRPFHRGSHMPMIAKTDVENIQIDVPPMDVQQRILALNGLLDEERRLSASILEKRTALIQSVLWKLMRTNKDN
jgi:restriction endonuclease S subunit